MNKKEVIDFIRQHDLLRLGTIKFSNGDYSDYFYDFARINSPESLSLLSGWLVDAIENEEFDCVFTSAYNGISILIGFVIEYNRRFPNKKIKFGYHKKTNSFYREISDVVGYLPQKGDRVLILDDILTTGNSVIGMVKAIKYQGADPVSILVSISRVDEKDMINLEQKMNVNVYNLIYDSEIIKDFFGSR